MNSFDAEHSCFSNELDVGQQYTNGAGRFVRSMRRRWRCLKRNWSHHGVQFVYGPGYVHPVSGVPIDPARAERILAFLVEEGLVHRDDLIDPRPASMRNLLRVHTPDYLDSLQHTDTLLRILGVPVDDDGAQKVVGLQRLMAGGTLQASRLARRSHGVVVNLGGGLHHAHRDSGMAFCVLNDIAVAIARLRGHGFGGAILIVDLDMHDGNGTRSIFAHDQSVHTYSIHNEHWGETEVRESTSIALGAGVEDEQLLGDIGEDLAAGRRTGSAGNGFFHRRDRCCGGRSDRELESLGRRHVEPGPVRFEPVPECSKACPDGRRPGGGIW